MKIAFVTNICAHYRVKTFESLAKYYNMDFYFFSAGDEWYRMKNHGVSTGNFKYDYLPGFHLGRTHVIPSLPIKLWRGNYDVIIKCINGRFALPITYIITRLKRKPFILYTGIWMRLQTFTHRMFFPLTRYFYHHSDAIVVYGEHVKRYLMSEGVSSERIFVANHAVDNDFYNHDVTEEEKTELRKKLGIDAQSKVVLYLGRLEEVKGGPYLIEAFASIRRDDTVLVFAGKGSEESRLKKLAHSMGITDKVRFAGDVPIDKTVTFYSIASVFVIPSVYVPTGKESWGLVVNEAMNQGVPVIATDAVGAAVGGLVKDGENGYIIPERDSKALKTSLEAILDNPDLREKLSKNARKIIADWNNERMVMGFRDAIKYVINQQ